ncbi:hypothetical protein AB9K34_14085 [Sedimentitalea sp. XS_ASV28]|uniref:hypothetical protein n=1 Tax=Sedimentitalea sp. XS_ASV28 TaxID=3241296 RepID=UPI003513A72E
MATAEFPVESFRLCQPNPAVCVGIGGGELHGLQQSGLVQDKVVIGNGSKLDHAPPYQVAWGHVIPVVAGSSIVGRHPLWTYPILLRSGVIGTLPGHLGSPFVFFLMQSP